MTQPWLEMYAVTFYVFFCLFSYFVGTEKVWVICQLNGRIEMLDILRPRLSSWFGWLETYDYNATHPTAVL